MPVYRFNLFEVPDHVDRYVDLFNTDRPMANRRLFAKFEVRSSLRSDAIVTTADGRRDRHCSNVLEFRADQMSPRNVGSQIIISRCISNVLTKYTLYEEGIKI